MNRSSWRVKDGVRSEAVSMPFQLCRLGFHPAYEVYRLVPGLHRRLIRVKSYRRAAVSMSVSIRAAGSSAWGVNGAMSEIHESRRAFLAALAAGGGLVAISDATGWASCPTRTSRLIGSKPDAATSGSHFRQRRSVSGTPLSISRSRFPPCGGNWPLISAWAIVARISLCDSGTVPSCSSRFAVRSSRSFSAHSELSA